MKLLQPSVRDFGSAKLQRLKCFRILEMFQINIVDPVAKKVNAGWTDKFLRREVRRLA